MIIDEEKNYLIATPSKCGTTSVERMAKQNPNVFTVVRPYQHRMLVPAQYADDYERFLLVRNSYERLVSIWSYLANPANYTQWGAKEVQSLTFSQFLRWWLKHRRDDLSFVGSWLPKWWRSPHLWLITNEECRQCLTVDYEHCITIDQVPALNPEAWGDLKHVNASLHRPGVWQDYWTPMLIDLVHDILPMPQDKAPVMPSGKFARKTWDQIATNR